MKSLKTLGAVALLSTSMLGAATSFAAETGQSDQQETPVQAKFKLPENGGKDVDPENPTTPDSPNDPDKNKPLHPNGPFGIDYIPNVFQTKDYADGVALQEEGQQVVPFTNTDARIGVKDKTRTPGGWTLSATLGWDNGKQVPGATIDFEQGKGVQINEGDHKYKAAGESVTGSRRTINGEASPIMIATTLSDGSFYDAVYDLDMSAPKLTIPDASKVQAGDYSGKVTWKLTAAAI